ncbi:copper chaperone PCu(A)C [Novosphingobium sp. MW5]|nr:copper chaperone PCu(A)C [Novosphingobium sp. MW5]
MRAVLLAPALVSALFVAGCSGQDAEIPKTTAEGVQVLEPRMVLPIVKDSPGAVYFNLVNDSDKAKKVMSIDVAGTDMAMIHDTIETGGRSSMQMAQNVVVPAHGSMAFAPGGRHVMVTGIKGEIKAGVNTVLKINFDDGDVFAAPIPVIPPAAAAGN